MLAFINHYHLIYLLLSCLFLMASVFTSLNTYSLLYGKVKTLLRPCAVGCFYVHRIVICH